jgi:hypothetical protein
LAYNTPELGAHFEMARIFSNRRGKNQTISRIIYSKLPVFNEKRDPWLALVAATL